jgi:hypothetical protein
MTKFFPQLYNQPEDDRGTRENRKFRRGDIVEVFPAIRPAIINVYKKVDPKFINQKLEYQRFSPISKMTAEQKAKYKEELHKAEEREKESLKKHTKKYEMPEDEKLYEQFIKANGGERNRKHLMNNDLFKQLYKKSIKTNKKFDGTGKILQVPDDYTFWFKHAKVRRDSKLYFYKGILFVPSEYLTAKFKPSPSKKPSGKTKIEKPLGKKIVENPLGKKPLERKLNKVMTDKDRELMEKPHKGMTDKEFLDLHNNFERGVGSADEIQQRVKKLSKAISRKNIIKKATKIYGGMLW